MNIIEKYCLIKMEYIVNDMLYKKTLNQIREIIFNYCDLYNISR